MHKNDFRCISISKSIGKGRGCMQEENDYKKDLEEVLASLRETAGENRESLKNRYEAEQLSRREVKEEREEPAMAGNGSFYLRTLLCLLLFLGLLILRRENRSVLGLSPEELKETISAGILLQETMEETEK